MVVALVCLLVVVVVTMVIMTPPSKWQGLFLVIQLPQLEEGKKDWSNRPLRQREIALINPFYWSSLAIKWTWNNFTMLITEIQRLFLTKITLHVQMTLHMLMQAPPPFPKAVKKRCQSLELGRPRFSFVSVSPLSSLSYCLFSYKMSLTLNHNKENHQ